MLRKRPKTSRSNQNSNILNTKMKKVLDDATKQSLHDMFEYEDYVKKMVQQHLFIKYLTKKCESEKEELKQHAYL